jgi:hypothetical protein
MVDYEEAFRKPFTDLMKLVLGIVLSIIPIVQFVAYGFAIECSGVGKNKLSKKMPEWKDYVDYFVKGLISAIIGGIYLLPAIIVFAVGIGYAAASLATVFLGGNWGSLTGQMGGQNWMLALPSLLAAAPLILLGLLLMLVGSYFSPIAVLNYIKSKKFAKAFDFSQVYSKALSVKYLVVWIIAGVVSIVLNAVLSIIPWLGSAIAFFVAGVIAWSLYGQVYREK